ncbi:MAG: EAL domain-containing protein [Steroidobacteraceae bacterium]
MSSGCPFASDRPGNVVLVVDDDDIFRLLITTVLADAGYEVVSASNGIQALEIFASRRVDCVVTDIGMPLMDGFELCAGLRALGDGQRVQVLFLTGLEDHDSIQRAYDAGASDFAGKQTPPGLLVERVRFLMRAQRTQDELRVSEQRLAYAERLARLGHWERSAAGATIAVSPVVCELFDIAEPAQLDWRRACERAHPEDREALRSAMRRALEAGGSFKLEHRVVDRLGTVRVLQHQGVVGLDEHSERIVRSSVQDVTEARAQEERIRFLAFHDPLTALPNRDSIVDTLDGMLGGGPLGSAHVAVLAVRLDDFERVASLLGRSVLEAVLKTVGERLRSQLRTADLATAWRAGDAASAAVARADADKFLCVVAGLQTAEAAVGVVRRLQAAVAEPLALGDSTLHMTASVGVSLHPEDGHTANELVDHALAALLHASGRKGACQFFASEISSRARRRLSLESELRRAIEERQFELHFQPRIGLADDALRGAEALVRWRHPARGLVAPGDFIPLLEETGLIGPLGSLVIDLTAQRAAAWQRSHGDGFRLSFNASPLQFGAGDLVAEVDRAVARHGARHQSLEIELTESALMGRSEKVVQAMQALRKRGVHVALDDFGTGFSSLSYLQRLPLDSLKIDRSFVADIGVTRGGGSLVCAILQMAQALQLMCVAEGVESQEQRDFLQANGCDEAQGFLLAPPLAATQFEEWALRRSPQAAGLRGLAGG